MQELEFNEQNQLCVLLSKVRVVWHSIVLYDRVRAMGRTRTVVVVQDNEELGIVV